MISVLNRRQRLNGSKFLFLFVLLGFLASCDALKPLSQTKKEQERRKRQEEQNLPEIQPGKVYDPETGTYKLVENPPTEKMDTIVWKDIPPGARAVITLDGVAGTGEDGVEYLGEGEGGSQLLSTYNVTVAMPFLTNIFDVETPVIDEDSKIALHFYAGVQMALDVLQNEGVGLKVDVIDTKASEREVQNMTRNNKELRNSHVIIGPYRSANVQLMANYAKRRDITLVSPFSARSKLSENNPNYVQINPTLESHCQAITRHVLKNYSPEKVVLVAQNREAEIARFDYFHKENYKVALEQNRDTIRFREYIINDQSVDLNQMDLLPFMNLTDTTVFIVPSWADEKFVYSFMQKVDLARQPDQYITIFGFPKWMEYQRIDYDYYEKLNVHVTTSSFLDPLSYDIRYFKRQYFDRYGEVPTEDAYLGYDTMLFTGRMLYKYGTKFQFSFEKETERYLHTRFSFQRLASVDTRNRGSDLGRIEQFENKYVNILKFSDYQFQLINQLR